MILSTAILILILLSLRYSRRLGDEGIEEYSTYQFKEREVSDMSDQTITVRIKDQLSVEGKEWWYKDRLGSTFKVRPDPVNPQKYFYLIKNCRKHQIRRCDCTVVVNVHDQRRRNKSIAALLKAKEALEAERLYLSVQDPAPMDELYKVHDCLDHVVNALDRLTVAEGGEQLGD